MRDFDDFVTGRSPALLRFAYLLTGDRHLAEDLTQEALVRAHRRWHAIVGEDGPEPYVRQAILRQYLSWRRRRASTERPVAEPPDAAPHGADLADRVVDADELWTALRALPRSQRAVVVLRYYEDLPDAQIARLLGCAPATVRVHAFHALHRLRSVLTPVPSLRPGGAP
ncbi:SigE family RNA polymerase sigma factor [Dactylosporangium aurantiacum]|uniref:SigE family RNA polymerase sigma factor n=1 Tax=Dactylosporangium aurantiacum TaxID=35754 RepID=A0A9Q9MGF2_9ACTN|nr:SigE family RNA polymerase sigma factor [Dactylosporangium aurantiacum]MDG6110228.1 SigE family RNA polymerase sigma factor [Dactylosporangium aurantiacum]UWZ55509.1 SigE family RNA polymerase sigma factor [Dactylosporangium aurantiacum]